MARRILQGATKWQLCVFLALGALLIVVSDKW